MRPKTLLKRAAALTLLGATAAIGSAQAQIQSGGGPTAITADSVDYVGPEAVATYRGNVEAVQGTTRLRCSELRIRQQQAPGGGALSGSEPERYECSGPVYYVTPTEQAKGDAATYTLATETIVMTGNVTVQQGQNVAQGDKLTINTRTRNTQLISSGSKRVRTVIYPDQPAAAGRPGGE